MADRTVLNLATELTVAWLGNPHTRVQSDEVPAFLVRMHDAVGSLSSPAPEAEPEQPPEPVFTPAVSVRKSLASPDHLVSMIDGKPYSSLKRHLSANGLTPDQYRERYGLRPDYPMVAPNYSAKRRAVAVASGLGRKAKAAAAAVEDAAAEPVKAVAKRARTSISDAKRAAQAHLGLSSSG